MFLAAHGASGQYGSFLPNDRLHKIQDTLGNDLFVYESTNDSGLENQTRDHILDFEYGDKIDLSRIDAKTGFTDNDSFTFIGTDQNLTTANANGAVWVVGDVVYGSTDTDTGAEFSLQLVGVSSVSASDFIM